MTQVAGCDVGSLTAKAVVMDRGRLLGSAIVPSGASPRAASENALAGALAAAGLRGERPAYCVGTGYGRNQIGFVEEAVSEITCHGAGARWLLPSARTVIDIGGQDAKVLRLDEGGKVAKFVTNDKCAAGTGRFLEVMARVLGVAVDKLGAFSRRSKAPVTLASTCTVWAQADVIKFINTGVPLADIGAGINAAMANRVALLANSLTVRRDVVVTGGVAHNAGVVATLGALLGQPVRKVRKASPQLAGAIGAALLAAERLKRRR